MMANEWREELLVDCLETIIDYRGKTPKKSDDGILTLSAKSVKMGKIDYGQAYFISEKTYAKFMVRGFPKVGDVLMTTEAPLGCVARLDRDDVGLAQRLITLRGKNDILDNGYLLYFLMSARGQHELLSRASGTTVQGIKRTEFAKVKIPVPPLPEQQRIAQILTTLDNKIELNRQMNQALEQMAQALFKSWFVNFDPVIDNALAAGNPIPDELQERAERRQKANNTKQLPADIQKLFPAEFEFNEELDKWVPLGWRIQALNKFINVKHGFGFKGKYFSPEPTTNVLLTPGNFKIGGGFKGDKFKYYNGEYPEEYILKNGDLIITMTDLSKAGDTLGYPAIVPNGGNKKYLHNQRLGKVEYKTDSIDTMYLYQCLCSDRYRNEILGNTSGSTVKHTSPTKILAHKIAFSQVGIENKFSNYVTNLNEKIAANNHEIDSLTKLRDTLLPKLISGKIRVPENNLETQ